MDYTHIVLARTVDERLRAYLVTAAGDEDASAQVLAAIEADGGPTFASVESVTAIPEPAGLAPVEVASVYVGPPTT